MTKNIYKGRIVNLNLETVTLPNGATVELEVIHIYKATQLQRGKQNLGHDEVLAIAEFPLEKTIAMIREGVIKDAKTIVGLQCVYLQLLGENIGEEG